ncbi:hypothetical protein [Kitasatospora mediocidica]|uniref:hypothetical protein n=1 Tax=Kitasatospora mediocidica TaxID=58352 RepID=UPI000560A8BB|nr:hypothetical protein [Kitasatospora mediocidica]
MTDTTPLSAIRADIAASKAAIAEARGNLDAMRQHTTNASTILDGVRAGLDRIERRNAECPTCDGTDGDHQIGCREGEL